MTLDIYAKSQDLPDDPLASMSRFLVVLEDGSVFKLEAVQRYGKPALEVTGYSFPNHLVIEPLVANQITLSNDPQAEVI